MDRAIKKGAIKTLADLGVGVQRQVGRPPRGLAAGQEVWLVGDGPDAPRVLATPLLDVARTPVGGPALNLPRLWIAEYIPAPTAERLIHAGDGFVDLAGNAHLKLPGIVVHVLGQRAPRTRKVREQPVRREWRTPALRVLFHLLCNPDLADRPLREIATAGATAPGTIVNLFRDLERTGNLVHLGGHKRRFVPDQNLVDTWIAEYEYKLRHKLFLGRFRAPDPNWWHHFEVRERNALWGGEVAATLLGADLRPGVVTLYTNEPIAPLLKAARLVPDPEGKVEIRRIFWTGVMEVPRDDVTHPLLVVADLMATRDGRCAAAARYIWEAYSIGLVEQD